MTITEKKKKTNPNLILNRKVWKKSKLAGSKRVHKRVVPGTWRGSEEDCWGEIIKAIVKQ